MLRGYNRRSRNESDEKAMKCPDRFWERVVANREIGNEKVQNKESGRQEWTREENNL